MMMMKKLLTLCSVIVFTFILGCASQEKDAFGNGMLSRLPCQNNLRAIAMAMSYYIEDWHGSFAPQNLEEVMPYMEGNVTTFRCPNDKRSIQYNQEIRNLADFASYYIRTDFSKYTIKNPRKYIIAYEKSINHIKQDMPALTVAFGDFHTELLTVGEFNNFMENQDRYGPQTRFFGISGKTPPEPLK